MKSRSSILKDEWTGQVFKAHRPAKQRLMVGIPTTGLIRYEWAIARYSQVIPCNWTQSDFVYYMHDWVPIGFLVADGRNLITTRAVEDGFEWLLFIDHDTILPPITLIRMNDYMLKKEYPVVCGLYFTKSVPAEPLIYRGRGTSYYDKWKFGDKVEVDGIPMGCTLIHTSIFKAMKEDAPEYMLQGMKVRKYFDTPGASYWDTEKQAWCNRVGTEDLDWCTRVIEGGYLKKAGWPKIAKKKYPFLVDTNIFCRHIDQDGVQYPSCGEEQAFVRK